MAWNDYLIENGWETPNFGKWTVLKSDENYASSYSDLVYDLLHHWAGSGGSNSNHVTDFRIINDNRYPIYLLLFDSSGEPYNAVLSYITPLYTSQCHMDILLNDSDYFHGDVNIDRYPLDEIAQGYPGCYPFNASGTSPQYGEIVTNMPVIACDYEYFRNIDPNLLGTLRANYLNNGDLTVFDEYIDDGHMVILNEAEAPEQKSTEFTIYNTGQKDKWTKSGRTFISGPYYRWCRIKMSSSDSVDGRLAFYPGGLSDGVIKLIPVSVADVVACEYSVNGGATWNESTIFPFDYIYGERTDEIGEFISATRTGIGGDTGVPIFEDEETALGWVNHDPNVSIDQALNYDDIAGSRYPINNPTGIEEQNTTMGTNSGLASLFSQKILCRKGDVETIAAGLYDTREGGIWEKISTGIGMMGESPINSVCGLMYFPVDLSQIFQRVSSQSYIYFGGYQFKPDDEGLNAISVLKITGYDGYLDIGEFNVERAFSDPEDVRNFEPYCNMSIYLPYIGIQKLSYNKYVGKTVKVRYYIDLNTGGCMACLFANGILYDYFNGTMGVQLPITLTDYAGFAAAELQNLSNLAGVGVNAGGAVAYAAGGNVMGAVVGAAGSVAGFEKSMYDISTTNINNFNQTKGGSSSVGNGYLPQYVYCIFEYIQTDETPNLIQLAGKASNASGNLNSFSGYLEVDDITLVTSAGMTEKEKQDFINLLHQGIII